MSVDVSVDTSEDIVVAEEFVLGLLTAWPAIIWSLVGLFLFGEGGQNLDSIWMVPFLGVSAIPFVWASRPFWLWGFRSRFAARCAVQWRRLVRRRRLREHGVWSQAATEMDACLRDLRRTDREWARVNRALTRVRSTSEQGQGALESELQDRQVELVARRRALGAKLHDACDAVVLWFEREHVLLTSSLSSGEILTPQLDAICRALDDSDESTSREEASQGPLRKTTAN